MQKTVYANTVNSDGKAFETIGENIRSIGSGGGSVDLKSILDILYPVGSYYVGDVPATWKTVSTWEKQGITMAVVVTNPDADPFAIDTLSGNIGEPIDTTNFLYFKRTA